MEKNLLLTDDLLWDYADGLLEAADHQRVARFLHQSPEAECRLAAILAEKKSFATLPLEVPGHDFTGRVLAAWTLEQMQPAATVKKGRDWMVLLITGVFGVMLLLPLFALVITALRSRAVLLPTEYALPTVDWTIVLGNPILHYAIGLAFIFITLRLLDKYLQQGKTWQIT